GAKSPVELPNGSRRSWVPLGVATLHLAPAPAGEAANAFVEVIAQLPCHASGARIRGEFGGPPHAHATPGARAWGNRPRLIPGLRYSTRARQRRAERADPARSRDSCGLHACCDLRTRFAKRETWRANPRS